MEIRTATRQEAEWISQIEPNRKGRAKGVIRLRVEAIGDEIAAFDGCCDETLGIKCPVLIEVRSALANVRVASPEKKFSYTHKDGAVFAWKIEG